VLSAQSTDRITRCPPEPVIGPAKPDPLAGMTAGCVPGCSVLALRIADVRVPLRIVAIRFGERLSRLQVRFPVKSSSLGLQRAGNALPKAVIPTNGIEKRGRKR
jgi:hypothetical protein